MIRKALRYVEASGDPAVSDKETERHTNVSDTLAVFSYITDCFACSLLDFLANLILTWSNLRLRVLFLALLNSIRHLCRRHSLTSLLTIIKMAQHNRHLLPS